MRLVDEDFQEVFDLPYTGLEDLSAAELLVVYMVWHAKCPCRIATIRPREDNESYIYDAEVQGTHWFMRVNENMNVDAVVAEEEDTKAPLFDQVLADYTSRDVAYEISSRG